MRSHRAVFLAGLMLSASWYRRPAAGAEAFRKLVPLRATFESANPSGATLGSLIRDAEGRTRVETGQFVTITDPVAGEGFRLDLHSKTGHSYTVPRQGARRVAGAQPDQGTPPTPIGTRVIEGCETQGVEQLVRSTVIMPDGKTRQIEQRIQVWSCKELALPLLVETSDPINGNTRHRYFDLQKGISVDPDLFKVPNGFTVAGDLSGSK